MGQKLEGDLTLCYKHIGIIFEDELGTWEANGCRCSGYIDENYDAVITDTCDKHDRFHRIPWDEKFERENLGE